MHLPLQSRFKAFCGSIRIRNNTVFKCSYIRSTIRHFLKHIKYSQIICLSTKKDRKVEQKKASFTITNFKSGQKYERGLNSDYLFAIYDYCKLRLSWPLGLVVSVWLYEPKRPGSIPLWAPIFGVLFSLFRVRMLNYLIYKYIGMIK